MSCSRPAISCAPCRPSPLPLRTPFPQLPAPCPLPPPAQACTTTRRRRTTSGARLTWHSWRSVHSRPATARPRQAAARSVRGWCQNRGRNVLACMVGSVRAALSRGSHAALSWRRRPALPSMHAVPSLVTPNLQSNLALLHHTSPHAGAQLPAGQASIALCNRPNAGGRAIHSIGLTAGLTAAAAVDFNKLPLMAPELPLSRAMCA